MPADVTKKIAEGLPRGYYRDDPRLRGNGAAGSGGPENTGRDEPIPDGRLWGNANAATVGPLRAPFGQQVDEVEVPCALTPAGVANKAVLLKRNDFDKPMYVRVRLGRNSKEGRIGVGPVNTISGAGGKQPMEWVDFTVQSGRYYDALLLPNDALYAIGTWPGVVPLSVFVSVQAWNP